MSWAKPPAAAPLFNASIALPERLPKLIAETFSRAMSYGAVHPGPPIRTRGGSVIFSTGATECTRYS